MALNVIATAADLDVGSSADDGTGDDLRAAFQAVETAWAGIDSNFDKVKSGVVQAKVVGQANGSVSEYVAVPKDCTVTAIRAMAPGSAPASSSGNVTLAVASGGNSLLTGATFDLKTLTGSETQDTVGLTATSANLDLSATQLVKITVASDNVDATDLTVYISVFFEAR